MPPAAAEHPDVRLAALAARQHGVVTCRQLAALGIGRSGLSRRVAAGRLHRLHRGVYAVGHPRCSDKGRALAAVLACGPRAVLSHRDAGTLWQLCEAKHPLVDVTIPARASRGPTGVAIHHTRRLDATEVTILHGIPVTTVARTLVDLSGGLTRDRVARVVREADFLGLLDREAVDASLARADGKGGTRVLRAVLAAHRPGTVVRSELEHRFLELCRNAGLPEPECNVPLEVAGRLYVVDCLWREQGVVVELDGAAAHAGPRAFEADRARDAALTATGIRPLRFTWRAVSGRPGKVISLLGATLG